MAHKGKLYKLWFRRDAAWELNNYQFAYPECYRIYYHDLIFSARYAVSQISQVMGVNLSKEYLRSWRSPTYGGIFDNVYWILSITSPPNEPVDEGRFAIWHSAVIDTPLFDATYRTVQTLPQYENFSFQQLKQLHYLSPDISVDPETFKIFFTAARYDRYNP